jgi:hypothetical protein
MPTCARSLILAYGGRGGYATSLPCAASSAPSSTWAFWAPLPLTAFGISRTCRTLGAEVAAPLPILAVSQPAGNFGGYEQFAVTLLLPPPRASSSPPPPRGNGDGSLTGAYPLPRPSGRITGYGYGQVSLSVWPCLMPCLACWGAGGGAVIERAIPR